MKMNPSGTKLRMSEINVRGLDQRTVTALKARASRHGRSLPSEVKHILQEVARPEEPLVRQERRKLQLRTVSVGTPAPFSRALIYGDGRR
jgi:plasmid stability protein